MCFFPMSEGVSRFVSNSSGNSLIFFKQFLKTFERVAGTISKTITEMIPINNVVRLPEHLPERVPELFVPGIPDENWRSSSKSFLRNC